MASPDAKVHSFSLARHTACIVNAVVVYAAQLILCFFFERFSAKFTGDATWLRNVKPRTYKVISMKSLSWNTHERTSISATKTEPPSLVFKPGPIFVNPRHHIPSGRFDESQLPITWTRKTKENPIKKERLVASRWLICRSIPTDERKTLIRNGPYRAS